MKAFALFITFFIYSICSAQDEKQLVNLTENYWKHYQEKDFDWIMKQYATVADYEFKHIAKYGTLQDEQKKRLKEVYFETKEIYQKSLGQEYGIRGIVERSILLDVKLNHRVDKLHTAYLKLIFKDPEDEQQYSLNTGLWFKNEKGKWVTASRKISGAYYGKRIEKKITKPYRNVEAPYIGKGVIAEPPKPPRKELVNKVFDFTEQMPTFPGGEKMLFEWIENNIQYPKIALENKITGQVYVTFIVEKDGTLQNIKIVRDIGGGCGKEAVRLIKKMPKWRPGKNNGQVVRTQFTLPVQFELDD